MSTNLSVLTKSHKVIAAKRRQKREQIKEIVFDEDARRCVLLSLRTVNKAHSRAGSF
jgi:hypothetical protein